MTILEGKRGLICINLHHQQPFLFINSGKRVSNIKKMWQYAGGDDQQRWNVACYVGSYRELGRSINLLVNEGYEPRIMADFTGSLLKGLKEAEDEGILNQMSIEKQGSRAGNVISELRKAIKFPSSYLEMTATGIYHPLFHPDTTPKEDWDLHIKSYRALHKILFGELSAQNLNGFWPPEMAVSGKPDDLYDLIEILHKNGIKWIMLPSVPYRDDWNERALKPPLGETLEFYEKYYAPHVIRGRKNGSENQIVALVRDPKSELQKGVDLRGRAYQVAEEYYRELQSQGKEILFPPIVLVASDGDNGDRMMQGNFFHDTFNSFVRTRPEKSPCALVGGTEYLTSILQSAFGEVNWSRAGEIFSEIVIQPEGYSWSGVLGNIWLSKKEKKDIYVEIRRLSEAFHKILPQKVDPTKYQDAMDKLLLTETSCYTWWDGSYWQDQAWIAIGQAWDAINSLLFS